MLARSSKKERKQENKIEERKGRVKREEGSSKRTGNEKSMTTRLNPS
jgi:hypothetical protein